MSHARWTDFLAKTLLATTLGSLGVFTAVRLALARDGVSGGTPRSFLTVSGVLTGVSGTPMATFRFSHGGAAATGDGGVGGVLCAPTVPIADIDPATHAFSVEVPLDQPGQECPSTLFDGSDAFVEVAIGATTVVARRAINPVPYARYAEQSGVQSDCPAGFQRDTSDATITASMRLCVRTLAGGRDEVVRVGSGASAFWIDRHEASVFSAAGTRFGESGPDYGSAAGGLAPNGRWSSPTVATPRLFAVSRAGVIPSRYVTWFQANELCRASGKRMMTLEEWFLASQGTDDPTTGNDGTTNARCNTSSSGPRATGLGATGCVSAWGAQDMIGNVWEITGEWVMNAGAVRTLPTADDQAVEGYRVNSELAVWGSSYADDQTWNVSSVAYSPNGSSTRIGLPTIVYRGGDHRVGTAGGIYAFSLQAAPSYGQNAVGGFRCVVAR